jgi:hypothetical protein
MRPKFKDDKAVMISMQDIHEKIKERAPKLAQRRGRGLKDRAKTLISPQVSIRDSRKPVFDAILILPIQDGAKVHVLHRIDWTTSTEMICILDTSNISHEEL